MEPLLTAVRADISTMVCRGSRVPAPPLERGCEAVQKVSVRIHGKNAVNPSAGRRLNLRSVLIRFSRVEWRINPNNIVVLGDYLTYIIDGLLFGTALRGRRKENLVGPRREGAGGDHGGGSFAREITLGICFWPDHVAVSIQNQEHIFRFIAH